MGIVPKNKKILPSLGRIVSEHGKELAESSYWNLYNSIIKELPVICKRENGNIREKEEREGLPMLACRDSTASVP